MPFPILPSILTSTSFSNPLLSTLVPSISLAYALQGVVAVPSILAHSERYYDLSGSLTYLSCTGLSLYLPALRARAAATADGRVKPPWPSVVAALTGKVGKEGWNWRQVVLSAAVGVWATRLGTYLYQRISASGSDTRFDTLRDSPPKVLTAFALQASWVSICLLPILALNSLPAALLVSLPRSVALTDVAGLSLFAGGLGLEIVADRQKAGWGRAKREHRHDEDFITSGLWAHSRHPNYFGETMLWTGIAVAAGGVLTRRVGVAGMGLAGAGWRGRALGLALAGVSPAFVACLLLFGSGVPVSERRSDEKFGHREDYRQWKRDTPVFWPKL